MSFILCIEHTAFLVSDKMRTSSRSALHGIMSVHTLQEAECALKAHPCEVVVCDIRIMGYAALSALRHFSDVPLVIIALVRSPGEGGAEYAMREALRHGADDVVPFTASLLSSLSLDSTAHGASVSTFIGDIWATLEVQQAKHDAIRSFVREEICAVARNISRALLHEFRTPLNSLIGFTEVLRQHHNLSQEHIDEAVVYISTSAQRLHRTAEKFLLYAELEHLATCLSDTTALQHTITNNVSFIISETATDETFQRGRFPDLVLATEGDDVPTLAIHARYFQFVVSELVSNACKFSPTGTPIEIRSRVNNNTFILEVRDCGLGMTEEQIQRITTFNQFNREQYEQQGVGLGLPIVKKIVEVFGGYCKIYNNTGGGVRVEIGLSIPD